MAATVAEEEHPFLLEDVNNNIKSSSYFASFAKWFLKSIMWLLFLSWIALFFLVPSDFGAQLYSNWVAATSGSVFGETGSALLIFNGPIFIIMLVAVPYLALFRKEVDQQKIHGNAAPRLRLGTFPVLVDGPFGVVSAAELIGMFLFLVFILWAAYSYTIANFEMLPSLGDTLLEYRFRMTAYRFGSMSLSIIAFLFLPIARGSILLRLVDIPFERATKYHAWLGHLTMFLLTLHGLGYMILWIMRGGVLASILEWKDDTGANFAGVISYAFGLLMWMTTLPYVKKRYFELFFYTHQLYILFVFFFALHVGDTVFSKAMGGIILLMLDRFLRFFQSRRTVNIISTTVFPCGTMKLVFSKPRNLQYNALNFIFLRVREISWLQWHPFSVSSSPLDGECHISILVKAVGSWTSMLKENISNAVSVETHEKIPFPACSRISASLEGPYGHELPYYLRYKNLILVAGGSGITPFLAIVSDIFHRVKRENLYCRTNILIVWAVKKSNEISLLSELDSIVPHFSDKLNVEIQTFITREPEPLLESAEVLKVTNGSVFSSSKDGSMSILVGSGNKIWSGVYFFASSVGFVICLSILEACYIQPFDILSWWYKGLLFLVCMVVSVFVFGGVVVGMWYYWGKKASSNVETQNDRERIDDKVVTKEITSEALASFSTFRYGCRPDFKGFRTI
ncbi:ferric reduction oxidase 7, chloroplastic-like isoform X2 [Euphorbia lathyris]|uniref:ferric reduction oxidase 7, chloroplastic-like isoform X2 n=1 Tax=Euphorbia lathyris TaxID=212925 RepID=UPI00331338B7